MPRILRTERQGRGWPFIDLAGLGRNTWRSYLATLLRVILLPLAFMALAAAALTFVDRRLLLGGAESVVFEPLATATIAAAGLALAWSVARSHRRPWMSLISPDLRLDWRRLAIGAGAEGMLIGLTIPLEHLMTGEPLPAGSGMPWPALTVVMLLVPFQAASEEMLCRGYLTQALGRLFRSRAAIAVVVAVAFGALHLNEYGALTIPYMVVVSLTFSLVSLRDGRLELVIGAHAADNWVAFGAFYEFGRDLRVDWTEFPTLIATGALFYWLTRLMVQRFCQPRPAT